MLQGNVAMGPTLGAQMQQSPQDQTAKPVRPQQQEQDTLLERLQRELDSQRLQLEATKKELDEERKSRESVTERLQKLLLVAQEDPHRATSAKSPSPANEDATSHATIQQPAYMQLAHLASYPILPSALLQPAQARIRVTGY